MDDDMSDALPWEVAAGPAPKEPGITVDLSRCIGCHACSVACKTAHELPLGTFRMRVRWLQRPDRQQLAFVPLFDPLACDLGASARGFGLAPECVRACPTEALIYGDRAEATSRLSRAERKAKAVPFPEVGHADIRYVGLEDWMPDKVNAGVPLSPQDDDIIYEQK